MTTRALAFWFGSFGYKRILYFWTAERIATNVLADFATKCFAVSFCITPQAVITLPLPSFPPFFNLRANYHPNMRSPKAMPQGQYIRARDNPYFDGLLRGRDAVKDQNLNLELEENVSNWTFSRSTSDISDVRSKKLIPDMSEKSADIPLEDSRSQVIEPLGKLTLGRSSEMANSGSVELPKFQSNLTTDFGDVNSLMKGTSPKVSEAAEEYYIVPYKPRTRIEKSYSLTKTKSQLSKVSLPPSAATFYNGSSPQVEIVESSESSMLLNLFLKSTRDDVSAGVPGRFLHVVIAQDASDIGSFASTIMYAFFLNETLDDDQLCTVPVINMKRADLNSRAEIRWLLDSCQIDETSLIFIDEIDLFYYDLFGSLQIVLINGHKLSTKQEALREALVEIFNGKRGESAYPGVKTVTVGQGSSCCTLVAEKFALTSPEILAGQGFSRLLLAGILLDTANLSSSHCTIEDKYIATLLIGGGGRFGCGGLYQILRYKMYDVSDLKLSDILRKDFKRWTRVGKSDTAGSRFMTSNMGMSSIGISIEQLLAHHHSSTEEIKYFQRLEKLRLLLIVSGYYVQQKNFKREVLVCAESLELMENLLFFFNSNASQVPLKVLHQPGLRDGMKAFEIENFTSRRTIERLLEEFSGSSKG